MDEQSRTAEGLQAQLDKAGQELQAGRELNQQTKDELALAKEAIVTERTHTEQVENQLRVSNLEKQRLEAEINVIVEEIGFVRDMSKVS